MVMLTTRSLSRSGATHSGGPFAKDDTTFFEIVRGHLDLHAVAHHGSDAESPHLASRVGDDLMIVLETDAKAPVRQNFVDQAVEDQQILFGQGLRPTEG